MRPKRPKNSKTRRVAVAAGFRSGFEQQVSLQLEKAGVEYEYETMRIKFTPKERMYKPDFILPNGVILEAKGRFTGADRSKHDLIRKQHPELDIRFVFMVNNTLSKVSKTTYTDWCDKRDIPWCIVNIPKDWFE